MSEVDGMYSSRKDPTKGIDRRPAAAPPDLLSEIMNDLFCVTHHHRSDCLHQ